MKGQRNLETQLYLGHYPRATIHSQLSTVAPRVSEEPSAISSR